MFNSKTLGVYQLKLGTRQSCFLSPYNVLDNGIRYEKITNNINTGKEEAKVIMDEMNIYLEN